MNVSVVMDLVAGKYSMALVREFRISAQKIKILISSKHENCK
jgi:hypothetical protein